MNIKHLKKALARRNPLLKIGYGKCGAKTLVYKPLLISGKKSIYLGEKVSIIDGARIEVLKKWGNQKFDSYLKIGDNTSFEQGCHIISAGKIEIGSNCVFSARTYISNCNHDYSTIGKNVLTQPLIVKNVKIGNSCFVGMDVKIFPGVTIGDNVIIGANSIVMKDIPGNSVVVGNPARIIKKYDENSNQWVRIKGDINE